MTVVDGKPEFDASDAAPLAERIFGVCGTAHPLPSERDQNFLITQDAGPPYVLKIANASESYDALAAQNAAMARAQDGIRFACPRPCPSHAGDTIARTGDGRHFVRLLTHLTGRPLTTVVRTTELLRRVGAAVAELDQAIGDLAHPGLERDLIWNLERAPEAVGQMAAGLTHSPDRTLVTKVGESYVHAIDVHGPDLPRGAIHNDVNDHNVLVPDAPDQPLGIIDFGDMVIGPRVFGLAVAGAYALLGTTSPLDALAAVTAGYHAVRPLRATEVEVILPAVQMRLALSVCVSRRRVSAGASDPYLSISEGPAWEALRALTATDPASASRTLFTSCAMPHA